MTRRNRTKRFREEEIVLNVLEKKVLLKKNTPFQIASHFFKSSIYIKFDKNYREKYEKLWYGGSSREVKAIWRSYNALTASKKLEEKKSLLKDNREVKATLKYGEATML